MSESAEALRVPLTPPQAVEQVAALRWRADAPVARPGLVLTHGAGSDLGDPVLRDLVERLAAGGTPVLAFELPYAAAGRRRPDPMRRLEAAYRDVLAAAGAALGPRPLVVGGRSLGGRVASHVVAGGAEVAGLCLLAYPLHPEGRPDRLRTDHWPRLAVPTLLVSGDRDRLCRRDLLDAQVPALAGPRTVHVLAGADHGFTVRARDRRTTDEVRAEAAEVVQRWLHDLGAEAPGNEADAPASPGTGRR